MHEFRDAEQVLDNHSLTSSLSRFLKKNGCTSANLDFLQRRVLFAYPKTLWIRLAVDVTSELKTRFTLPPDELGNLLRGWLRQQASFRRAVFDFRGVTIVDLCPLLQFLHTAAADLPARYYLCDPSLSPLLVEEGIEHSALRNSEPALLRELRRGTDLQFLNIRLPEVLSAESFEAAMLACAPPSALLASDVAVFDMTAVITVDFTAASLLTPIITSIAHRYGVLSSSVNMRRKVARELERLGALRPVSAYLIGSPEPTPPGLGDWANTLPMHAFRPDQLTEIRSLAEAGCRQILGTHTPWLSATSRLPMIPKPVSFELRATLVRSLLRLVDELIQNIAMHSHGRGYLMIELDPNLGLSVYVGDSGVGLAKELAKKYTLPISSDVSALRYALDLKQHRDKRRPVAGFRFGGRGLENVRQILSELRGEIKIRSGNAVARYSPSKTHLPLECSGRRYPIQGTHYNVFIPTPGKSQSPPD